MLVSDTHPLEPPPGQLPSHLAEAMVMWGPSPSAVESS